MKEGGEVLFAIDCGKWGWNPQPLGFRESCPELQNGGSESRVKALDKKRKARHDPAVVRPGEHLPSTAMAVAVETRGHTARNPETHAYAYAHAHTHAHMY